MLIWKMGSEV